MNTEAPGIEEQYVSACHTSNLRVEADRKGAGDLIIAAGMNLSRLGGALLRLHSEWDGSEKPRKWSAALVAELATTVTPPKATAQQKAVAIVKATAIAHRAYLHEMGILFGKLKTMPVVRTQVVLELQKWGIADAEKVGPAILLHWLDAICHPCGGLKFLVIANTSALSKNRCKACAGAGISFTPAGEVGKRLENFLDDCTHQARQQIRQRLRDFRS